MVWQLSFTNVEETTDKATEEAVAAIGATIVEQLKGFGVKHAAFRGETHAVDYLNPTVPPTEERGQGEQQSAVPPPGP